VVLKEKRKLSYLNFPFPYCFSYLKLLFSNEKKLKVQPFWELLLLRFSSSEKIDFAITVCRLFREG